MHSRTIPTLIAAVSLLAALVLYGQLRASEQLRANRAATPRPLTKKESLGRALFFDKNLSTPPGQACADCHAAEAGFGQPDHSLPVSRGAHPDRFGNRNDLPAAYAAFSPRLHYDPAEHHYVGGLFWDGRAATLEEQAKGPFLNPLEMANPTAEVVVGKVRAASYAGLFREVFGRDSLADPTRAFDLIAEAIAAYERSDEVNRFSSKFDAFLQGKVKLSEQEARGLELFEKKAGCFKCHPSRPTAEQPRPLLSEFSYYNLGVPKNAANPFYRLPKALNPAGADYVDLGLGEVLQKPEENGKFRVPTLRNVAVTAPYMHNGVFKTIREVVAFYNTRDVASWPPPEVPQNINREELGNLGLSDREVNDIVAFLHTLTDGYSAASR